MRLLDAQDYWNHRPDSSTLAGTPNELNNFNEAFKTIQTFEEAQKLGYKVPTGKAGRFVDSTEAENFLKSKGVNNDFSIIGRAKGAGYSGADPVEAYKFYTGYQSALSQAQNAGITIPSNATFDQLSTLIAPDQSKSDAFNTAKPTPEGDIPLAGQEPDVPRPRSNPAGSNQSIQADPNQGQSAPQGPQGVQAPGAPTPVTSTYNGPSIVDYLKSVGQDSSYQARAQLAKNMGIGSYSGTADQNTQLLTKLRSTAPAMGGSPVNGAITGLVNPAGSPGIDNTGQPMKSSFQTDIENVMKEFGIAPPNTLQSPQSSFSDTYKQVYDSLGLADVKKEIESYTKEYSALQDKKGEEASAINNNPWFTEGVRVKKLQQLDSRYEIRESNLLDKIKIGESLYDNGRQDAQYVTSGIMDQADKKQGLTQDLIMKAIDIAESRAEAERKEANTEDKILTPAQAKALGVPYGTSQTEAYGIVQPKSTGGTNLTTTQKKTAIQSTLNSGLAPSGEKIGNGRGSDGYTDPYVYIAAFENWDGSVKDFLTYFPVERNVNPLSYKILPQALQPLKKTNSSQLP